MHRTTRLILSFIHLKLKDIIREIYMLLNILLYILFNYGTIYLLGYEFESLYIDFAHLKKEGNFKF